MFFLHYKDPFFSSLFAAKEWLLISEGSQAMEFHSTWTGVSLTDLVWERQCRGHLTFSFSPLLCVITEPLKRTVAYLHTLLYCYSCHLFALCISCSIYFLCILIVPFLLCLYSEFLSVCPSSSGMLCLISLSHPLLPLSLLPFPPPSSFSARLYWQQSNLDWRMLVWCYICLCWRMAAPLEGSFVWLCELTWRDSSLCM